jgi:hypothetical protein
MLGELVAVTRSVVRALTSRVLICATIRYLVARLVLVSAVVHCCNTLDIPFNSTKQAVSTCLAETKETRFS